MSEEIDTNGAPETDAPEATSVALEPKKQRATRKAKAAAEVARPAAVKSRRAYTKKVAQQVGTEASAAVDAPTTGKGSKRGAKSSPSTSAVSKSVEQEALGTEIDGMSDLLRLEEENMSLRKALSEKLRTENADLRKRLGQA